MLDRDRRSLRAFLEEESERERLEREERDRPIREATEKLRATHRKLALIERERLTTIPDPERWLDPAVGPNVRMTEQQAADFNRDHAKAYRESHPEIYWSDALLDLLSRYFQKEHLKLITAEMLERLVERLAAVGLLPERPIEPEPDPVIEEEPVAVAQPERHVGIDPLTGEQREYTEREVARMTAEEFRRAFRITRASITLPTRAAF
jgi:hypothetical protein